MDVTGEQILRAAFEQDAVVRAYLHSATRSRTDADDLQQRVWLVVCRKSATFDPARSMRAWMLGIARLEVLKWRREQARAPALLSEETLDLLADTAVEAGDELDLRLEPLAHCLGQLAPGARRVLRWRYVERQSHAAIARMLGRSEAAAEMLLVRIRRALRQCIEQRLAAAHAPAGLVLGSGAAPGRPCRSPDHPVAERTL